MRLLQLGSDDQLSVTHDITDDAPPYAILSHTWGRNGEEVTYQDLLGKREKDKPGYQKILFCGQQAKRDGLEYFWVDTCCIDKTSSAELTEAINSMFKWYKDAKRCYVYLTDVSKDTSESVDNTAETELGRCKWKAAFRGSRWFTRGWTLQELIAPSIVEFFSLEKARLGDKQSLEQMIYEITRIPLGAIRGQPLSDFTIEERIAWSNRRWTTRAEDMAYSLLGVLDVSMPVIYGEGEGKALDRLRRKANNRQFKEYSVKSHTTLGAIQHTNYYIPFPKNRRFTGRGDILRNIQEQLFGPEGSQKLAIFGLGGMGKTQIALQLAYWAKEHQAAHSVLWIPALNLESFEQAATEIAKRLGIKKESKDEDAKISLQQYLELDENRKWFLVVDNADDMEVLYGSDVTGTHGIYQYLPTSENCIILFTTRSRDVALSVAETDVVELAAMSPEEAGTFFANSVVRKEILKDGQTVAELLEELAFLPLAIAQAAAYLNRNQSTVKRYLDLLRGTENETVRLMGIEFQDNTRYRGSQNALASTWLVSFDQIGRTDPFAADLLLFISLIEPRGIPLSLLPKGDTYIDTEQAIGTLCGYAFLTDRGNEVYDMHRLVHVAAKVWNSKQEPERTMTNALSHVKAVFPTSEPTNRELWRLYIPHAIRLLEESSNYGVDERYELSYKVGQCLYIDRRFKEAVNYLQQTLDWEEAYAHENDARKMTLKHWLATAYLDDRQIVKAIGILEHVVGVATLTLAEEDHERLASESSLASAYLDDRQIAKAIGLLEHVVEVRRLTLTEEDQDRLASEHELARAYLNDRQIMKAIDLLEHVTEVQTCILAEEEHSRLASEHELARAYLSVRQIMKAIKMLEHVVEVRMRTLAEEDHERLASEHELASAYLDNRQIPKAIELLEHVVEVETRLLAEEDHDRLASEHELARAYLNHRQIATAIRMLQHVVEVRMRTLAEEDHDRLASESSLASAYLDDQQITKAIRMLEHVVEVRERTLAEEDHDRLASEHELGRAYLNDRQIMKAIRMLEHVVEVRTRTLVREDHSRLASEHELAIAYHDDRQIMKAIKMLEHVVEIRQQILAEEDHSRLASEHELAGAYLEGQEIIKATKLFEYVVEVQARILTEEDHDRLSSEHELARAYLEGEQLRKATKILEHVVEVETRTLAEENYDRLASEHELARVYLDDQQTVKAIGMLEHVVKVQAQILGEEDHDRLTSEHELARAYLNDRQIRKAAKIIEHVVEVRTRTLAEGDPYRLSSVDLLHSICRNLESASPPAEDSDLSSGTLVSKFV